MDIPSDEDFVKQQLRDAKPRGFEEVKNPPMSRALNIVPSSGRGHDFSISAEQSQDPIQLARRESSAPDSGGGTGTPNVIVTISGAFFTATVPLSNLHPV